MASKPDEAAYHEAGHCYVAVRVVGRVVNDVWIEEKDCGWIGNTDVCHDRQNLCSWTTIALAGVVAEARADANQRGSGGARLVIARPVVEVIKAYVGEVVDNDNKKQVSTPRQITFRTSDGGEGVAAISPEDVRLMPEPYRDEGTLNTSLQSLDEIVGDPAHWRYIEALARELITASDHKLDRGRIETILGVR